MALVDIDTKGMIDEAANKLPTALLPVVDDLVRKLVEGLQGIIVGREITFTIIIK